MKLLIFTLVLLSAPLGFASKAIDTLIEIENKKLKGFGSRVMKTENYVLIIKDMASGAVRENWYVYKIEASSLALTMPLLSPEPESLFQKENWVSSPR